MVYKAATETNIGQEHSCLRNIVILPGCNHYKGFDGVWKLFKINEEDPFFETEVDETTFDKIK